MAYKTDINRVGSILSCLTPQKIIVHIPYYVEIQEFLKFLKEDGFNVMSLGIFDYKNSDEKTIKKINNFWNNNQSPIVICGTFPNVEDFDKIFTGIYSYIYVYPNSIKKYGEFIISFLDKKDIWKIDNFQEIKKLKQNKDLSWKKELENFIKKIMELNQSIFENHSEIFDNKIMVALI